MDSSSSQHARPLQAGLYPTLLILALDTPASLLLLLFRLSYGFCLAFYPCCSLDMVCPPSPMFASSSFQNLLLPEAFLFFSRTFDLFKIFYLWVHYYDHYHMLLLISTIYIPVFPSRMRAPGGQGWCLAHLCKILSSKLVSAECLAQRWYSRHGDLNRRFGRTSMLTHPLQCIETNVEGTDGTSVWDVAGATAE